MSPWTLHELTERVAAAVARLDLVPANGQVADVPNARTIRWYQTIGLLARPEQRGRTAYYGPSHLRQLVAIKRLQAQGLPLATIQHALLGRTEAEIAAIASVPEEPAPRFWAEEVALPEEPPAPRLCFDHPAGVSLTLSHVPADRHEEVRAILSELAKTLIQRGLIAHEEE
jgi:DNA-binding transcriptional MerR regulator